MSYVRREHIEYEHGHQSGIAVYHDKEYRDRKVDIEVCLAVKRKYSVSGDFSCRELGGVDKMACMMVYGPYEIIASAYRSFVDWLDKNRTLSMGGQSRQISIIGPEDTDDPAQYLTEIQIPLVD